MTTIGSTAELISALKAAQGGETLALASGSYSGFTLIAPRAYASTVTITAADPANPPVFAGAIALRGFTNVSITGVAFTLPGNRITYLPMIRFYGGKAIAITGNRFTGEKDATDYYGYGIQADGIDGLTIAGNGFTVLHRGALLSNCKNFAINDNDVADIRVDGFIMAAMATGTILRNGFEGFQTGDEHPDAIQIHANGYAGSSNIEIADNLVISDADNRIQGIFITGSQPDQPIVRHTNIAIHGNKLAATMWNAISPSAVDGLSVNDNEVLSVDAPDKMISRINYHPPYSYQESVGTSANNKAHQFLQDPKVAQTGDETTPLATQADVDAMQAAWLAKFRPQPAPPPPAVDPLALVDELASTNAAQALAIAQLRASLGG